MCRTSVLRLCSLLRNMRVACMWSDRRCGFSSTFEARNRQATAYVYRQTHTHIYIHTRDIMNNRSIDAFHRVLHTQIYIYIYSHIRTHTVETLHLQSDHVTKSCDTHRSDERTMRPSRILADLSCHTHDLPQLAVAADVVEIS